MPFKELDFRTIEYLQKTKVENIKKLIKEMEENNEKIKNDKENEVLDIAKTKIKEMNKFIQNKGNNFNLSFEDSYKTKWV